jgi:hypothetical protein
MYNTCLKHFSFDK